MTLPFNPSFPNVGSTGVINDPGIGATIAQGLAGVLAAQQQAKENEYRMQELATQQAQQQALAQYYQGAISVQSRQQASTEEEQRLKRGALQQVGQAQQAALGVGSGGTQTGTAGPPTTMGYPTQAPGEFTQIIQGGGQAVAPGMNAIFGGVSAENMPAAVQGVQEAQALQPKPEELPTSGKEFMFAQKLATVDPALAKFFIDNWVNKGPQTVVNNMPGKVETAFGVEMAKGDVKMQGDALEAAQKASSSFPSMKEAYDLFQKGTVIAGLGAKPVLQVNRVLAAMGYDSATIKAADTQTAMKLLRDGVLAQLQTRALGSGTAVSDKDREYMESVQGADLTMQPDAIKRILRINVGLAIEKMVSAKMLLEQQMVDHPESQAVLKGKLNLIEKKLTPIFDAYMKMKAEEAKTEARLQMQTAPTVDQLFPVR